MELDERELEATKNIKRYENGKMTLEFAIRRLTNLAQEKNANWLGLTNIEAMEVVLKDLEEKNKFIAKLIFKIGKKENKKFEDIIKEYG